MKLGVLIILQIFFWNGTNFLLKKWKENKVIHCTNDWQVLQDASMIVYWLDCNLLKALKANFLYLDGRFTSW